MSSPHDDSQDNSPAQFPKSGDRDATRYGATPPADPAATRYPTAPLGAATPLRHGDPAATRYPDMPDDSKATETYSGTAAPPDTSTSVRLPRRFGAYELLEELGRGGMGVVYKARQFTPERLVALKVIRTGELAEEEDVQRFRREADEVARLDHPNIVPVYEVGEQDGLQYFGMKLVEGGSLNKRLGRYQNEPKAAARLVATAARAVHHAHQRQLLHRDLKPGNILLDAAGQPHVADFGLAKRMEDDVAAMSRSNAIVGTPEYMAPEQARGEKRLTTAADVYALGGVLYALLTGRPPFQAKTPLDVLVKVVSEEPAPPSRVRPGAPRDLETICLKCLAKEPTKRYGSAEALAEDLERWLRGEPVRARPVRAAERLTKWARRRPALAAAYGLLLAALVLGLGGGGATWLWRRAENARGEMQKARDNLDATNGALRQAQDDLKDANRRLIENAYADKVSLAQRVWDVGGVAQARELLNASGDLREELTPGRRAWEWDYFNRLIHPEVAVLEGRRKESSPWRTVPTEAASPRRATTGQPGYGTPRP